MDKIIIAIKDTAVQAFGQPQTMRSQGEALRSFQDLVNDPAKENAIAAHPEDYELYKLAEYNDQTGKITATATPELITRARDVLIKRS